MKDVLKWGHQGARVLLGWRPIYDLHKLTDAAFDYQRPVDDPRIVWYPG